MLSFSMQPPSLGSAGAVTAATVAMCYCCCRRLYQPFHYYIQYDRVSFCSIQEVIFMVISNFRFSEFLFCAMLFFAFIDTLTLILPNTDIFPHIFASLSPRQRYSLQSFDLLFKSPRHITVITSQQMTRVCSCFSHLSQLSITI